jgi:ribosome-binding factor A
MNEKRKQRLESLLKREIANILQFEIEKPEDILFVTVNRVILSKDGRKAKVFISCLNHRDAIKMVAILNKISGYIQHLIGKRLRIKFTPKLSFEVEPLS